MRVRRVRLRDFRNYVRLDLDLEPGIVVFHGPNGAGKTNLLEAVCLAAQGDSPRARTTGEMVRLGAGVGFVGVEFAGREGAVRVEIGLSDSGERRVRINGANKRRADLIGLAPVEQFSTRDIEVIRGEPGARRRLLDEEICAVSRPYYFSLGRYRRAIDQRNRLLKDLRNGQARADGLAPWDRAAARYGARVMLARRRFICALGPEAGRALERLSGGEGDFVIHYLPSIALPMGQRGCGFEEDEPEVVEEVTKAIEDLLRKRRAEDVASGMSLHGPHRDEVELMLDGRAVRTYGSQGQQRSCALAIRLGLSAVAQAMTGKVPVLLLDDVLSELDARRRQGVFDACEGAEQVLISCCDPEDIPAEVRRESQVLEVRDGKVC